MADATLPTPPDPTTGTWRLKQIGLAKLLHNLAINERTGTLVLKRGEVSKSIFFKSGYVMFAESNLATDRLGEVLCRRGEITRSQLSECLAEAKKSGKMLGAVLVEKQVLRAERLLPAIEVQVREIVLGAFAWDDGEYLFSKEFFGNTEDLLDLKVRTADLILEGVRRTYTAAQSQRTLGDTTRPPRLSAESGYLSQDLTVGFEVSKVLSKIDGKRTIPQIVAETALTELAVLQILAALAHLKIVDVDANAAGAPAAAPPAAAPAPTSSQDVRVRAARVEEMRAHDEVTQLLDRLPPLVSQLAYDSAAATPQVLAQAGPGADEIGRSFGAGRRILDVLQERNYTLELVRAVAALHAAGALRQTTGASAPGPAAAWTPSGVNVAPPKNAWQVPGGGAAAAAPPPAAPGSQPISAPPWAGAAGFPATKTGVPPAGGAPVWGNAGAPAPAPPREATPAAGFPAAKSTPTPPAAGGFVPTKPAPATAAPASAKEPPPTAAFPAPKNAPPPGGGMPWGAPMPPAATPTAANGARPTSVGGGGAPTNAPWAPSPANVMGSSKAIPMGVDGPIAVGGEVGPPPATPAPGGFRPASAPPGPAPAAVPPSGGMPAWAAGQPTTSATPASGARPVGPATWNVPSAPPPSNATPWGATGGSVSSGGAPSPPSPSPWAAVPPPAKPATTPTPAPPVALSNADLEDLSEAELSPLSLAEDEKTLGNAQRAKTAPGAARPEPIPATGKSRRGLFIGLGGLVAVIAGAGVAFQQGWIPLGAQPDATPAETAVVVATATPGIEPTTTPAVEATAVVVATPETTPASTPASTPTAVVVAETPVATPTAIVAAATPQPTATPTTVAVAPTPAPTKAPLSPEEAAAAKKKQAVSSIAKGEAALNAGDADKAIALYGKAVSLDPTNPKAHLGLGGAYLVKGDNAKAKKSFQKFLDLAPNDPLAGQTRQIMGSL